MRFSAAPSVFPIRTAGMPVFDAPVGTPPILSTPLGLIDDHRRSAPAFCALLILSLKKHVPRCTSAIAPASDPAGSAEQASPSLPSFVDIADGRRIDAAPAAARRRTARAYSGRSTLQRLVQHVRIHHRADRDRRRRVARAGESYSVSAAGIRYCRRCPAATTTTMPALTAVSTASE